MKRASAVRPCLETLEDRFLLATCDVIRLANLNAGHDLGTGQARGSLPYCINFANNNPGPDSIDFNVTGTISPSGTNLPGLNSDMTIVGPGADLLTISDCHSESIFVIGTGATVTISGLTMANCDHGLGPGGIDNHGTLTLEDSTVTKNLNWFGDSDGIASGIYNRGTMTILRSTISENEVAYDFDYDGYGAGIYNTATGVMLIENSTISGNLIENEDTAYGAGIYNRGSLEIRFSTITNNQLVGNLHVGGAGIHNAGLVPVKLYNTIVAGNSGGPDIVGSYTGSANLIGGNPKLGVLQYNGGHTKTHKVLQMSPALDAGNNTGAPQWDQRGPGFPRIVNGTVDIGAFEVQSTGAPTPPVGGDSLFLVTADIEDKGRETLSPVDQRERMPELLDALVMSSIAGHELQAILQGNGGNHRIGAADGLAGSTQVPCNAARQLGGWLVEGEDFFGRNGA